MPHLKIKLLYDVYLRPSGAFLTGFGELKRFCAKERRVKFRKMKIYAESITHHWVFKV